MTVIAGEEGVAVHVEGQGRYSDHLQLHITRIHLHLNTAYYAAPWNAISTDSQCYYYTTETVTRGTGHALQAISYRPSVRQVIAAYTDKVYKR